MTRLDKHDYLTIKSFFVHKSPSCRYLPSGVEKFLTQLEVLVIAGTGLKSITSSDLKPFELLKELYLNDNELAMLDSDLFEFNPEITIVNFNTNQLKQIGHDLLVPLTHLQKIAFNGNDCIDMKADNAFELAALMTELREKCPQTEEVFEETTLQPETSPQVQLDQSQRIADLELKISELETKLNKTVTELIATTNEFCQRYNDWDNEKCKGLEGDTRVVFIDDQTEGFIENVES